MPKHELGDLLLAYTATGQYLIGMVSSIEESQIDIYHNLYHITWLTSGSQEINSAQYTYTSITGMKNNLQDFLYNYDKT